MQGQNTMVALKDDQLSAIYLSADEVSGRGQKRTKFFVKLELAGLIVAALAGITSARVGSDRLDILAAVSGLAFAASLGSTALRAFRKPEGDWYAGRAAAESVRTMAWRYAVGGEPFPKPIGGPDNGAANLYLDRIQRILNAVGETELDPSPVEKHELTDAMKAVRQAQYSARRAAYKRDRIEDQLGWYRKRTLSHGRSARLWLSMTAVASGLGFIAAVLKFFGFIDVDMLGVFGAVASAAIAWNQLNQHRTLVSAYGVTARELSIIRDRIDGIDEAAWPQFVSDSEDAISREHTMWLARHGHLVKT